jgi:hypothetical protein
LFETSNSVLGFARLFDFLNKVDWDSRKAKRPTNGRAAIVGHAATRSHSCSRIPVGPGAPLARHRSNVKAGGKQGKVHAMRFPRYLPVPVMLFVSELLAAARPE